MAPADGLLYALVGRGTVVLAECSQVSGNASVVALSLLEKLPPGDTKASFISDRHVFHVLASDGLVFLVMADEVRRLI